MAREEDFNGNPLEEGAFYNLFNTHASQVIQLVRKGGGYIGVFPDHPDRDIPKREYHNLVRVDPEEHVRGLQEKIDWVRARQKERPLKQTTPPTSQ